MNGRAYDYNLGRFLSVDPFIQEPGNSQSMNPYSYIMNNPLAGTDPSGYVAECEQALGKGCGDDEPAKPRRDPRSGKGFGWQTVWANSSGKVHYGTVEDSNGKRHNAVIRTNVEVRTEDIESTPIKDIDSITIVNGNEIDHRTVRPTSGGTDNSQSSIESFVIKSNYRGKDITGSDEEAIDATKRMVKLTTKAVNRSEDKKLIAEWNNTEFIYDPHHPTFSKKDVAAFRVANEVSTTIYVGRNILTAANSEMVFEYHGTTIRGGDTGLLFVGLHEFGHVVGRANAKVWGKDKKEIWANAFAEKYYPRTLIGTSVNRNDIDFK